MAHDEKRIERIEFKVDGIKDDISSIKVTLVAQHESLKEHMRRTAALEKVVEPITKHVSKIEFIPKIMGGFLLLCGVLKGIIILAGYFK